MTNATPPLTVKINLLVRRVSARIIKYLAVIVSNSRNYCNIALLNKNNALSVLWSDGRQMLVVSLSGFIVRLGFWESLCPPVMCSHFES